MPSLPTESDPLKRELERLKREQSRRRARNHLYDFALHRAPLDYQFSWHHQLLYTKLHNVVIGKCKRLIIEMPPGHGKSEGVSRNMPAFAFGHNPDTRIIACSYNGKLATEMNLDVQKIMESEEYQSIFPGIKLGENDARKNSDLFDIPNRRGFYFAAGIGGGIGGRRFDLGIIDDPIKDRQDANSYTYRESSWRWFTSTFCTRQAKNARIVITSTRWHEDDLVGRIKERMKTGDIEPYEILTLPAIATDNRHPLDPRQPGEALWPWLRPIEELRQMERTEPRDFYALQQQDPRAEGSTEWDAKHFGARVWFDDYPKEILQFLVIALDPSKGKDAAHGDYSALVSLARDNAGTLWVEADLARRPTTKIVEDGIEFARKVEEDTGLDLEGFGVESNQFQELLADEFIRQTKAKGFSLPIYKINNNVNKEVRIRRLTADVTTGNVRFRNTPGTRLLVSQMQQFPIGDHDDGPDALETAKRLAVKLWNQRAKK